MGILFISHSSRDNAAALKVSDWLKQNGWGDVFLDLDPEQGLAAGQRWQQELKQAGERCSGVLVLLSPDWIASRWCQTEFLIADQLGKKIFPLFVAPTPFDDLPLELKAKFQIVDISTPQMEAEGFQRLAVGLKRSGLDPKSFHWPPPNDPHRPIYRGLESLDEQDAAIFFGRDALITKALDTLRRMRDGAPERVLLILGASGAGKSSFLRAGLIARLKRDEENFLVLPVIRPERAALTGPHGLAASLGFDVVRLDLAQLNDPEMMPHFFAQARMRAMERLRRFADAASENIRPPTIVIAIDQAEEFFSGENAEAALVLDLLVGTVQNDRNAIIVATIRSDSFAKLQGRPRLGEIPLLPFNLPPIPLGAFKEVIECPPRLANPPLTVEPALIDRLLQDLAAEDALPLLALTLERLSSRHRAGGMLTLAEYLDKLGGLRGAIVGAVEAAFSEAQRDPALPQTHGELEKLARAAFIPALVHLDDADAQPTRRVEQLAALPEATRPLVRHLINQRLLVTNRSVIDGVETDTVEVTHEAILRQWPALRAWIAEEREALHVLDDVRNAARDWHIHALQEDKGQSWLIHSGGRLDETERLLSPQHFSTALRTIEREYLALCRSRENAIRERERNEIAREKRAIAHTKRLQRRIFALIGVAVVIVLLAGFGITNLLTGINVRSSETLATLADQASESDSHESAARYALAGLVGADWSLLGFSGAEAERELRSAMALSQRLAVLKGHDGVVYSAAWSPDGARIVTASRDRTARIWDARSGAQITVLRGHEGEVSTAVFSPDGMRILTASHDGTARIWDAQNGTQILRVGGHGIFYSAAFSADRTRFVTASDDGTGRIWNSQTGAQVAVLRGHEDRVTGTAFSPDGTRIVTGSFDKTARIWDAASGNQIAVLRGHDGAIYSVAYSSDGSRIVTASLDKTARIWDARDGAQLVVLRGHEDQVQSASWSPDGTRVVTGSSDRTARVWDAQSGVQIAVFRGHEVPVESAAYDPVGTRIVTASDDRTARIWDARTGSQTAVLRGHSDPVETASFSPDGAHIVTASYDKTARIWDAHRGTQVGVLHGQTDPIASAAWSPDGRRIVTGSLDRTAQIWNASGGAPIAILRGHEGAIFGAAWSPNGARVVTASLDRTARLWDAHSGAPIAVLRGHDAEVTSAAWSPDGTRIATASYDKTVRVWNANNADQIAVLRGHEDKVTSAAWSADGKRIVTASYDKTVRIWDVDSGTQIAVLHGHADAVESAAFNADDTRIVTASYDKTARIWDAQSGAQIAVFRGHTDQLNSAEWSPDGRHIVTASDDATARIWLAPATTAAPLPSSRAELIARACATVVPDKLDHLTKMELAAAPGLDPMLDADTCSPPSLGARLKKLFVAPFSR